MNTYIDIEHLQTYAPIGVLAREHTVGNLFEVSLRLYYDASRAIETDSIDAAVNYAEVTAVVVETLRQPCALIEHAAGRIRQAIAERFPAINGGKITIRKLHPPIAAPTPVVGFTIEW